MPEHAATPWDDLLKSLQVILPKLEGLALDTIHVATEQAGHPFDWKRLPNWEDSDDTEILRVLCGSDLDFEPESVFLFPVMCHWKKLPPFLVKGEAVLEFVREFFSRYGEAFFNGDTIIFLPDRRTIYLFQHDGYLAKAIL